MPEIQERYLSFDKPRKEGELRPGDIVNSIGVSWHHAAVRGRPVVVEDILDGYGALVVTIEDDPEPDRKYWAKHFELITAVEDRCLR